MDFLALRESLRRVIADRIQQHEITCAFLAEKTGVGPAHISNFLHRNRGLSLHTMDCILEVLHLKVADLFDPAEFKARAPIASPRAGNEDIPLVSPKAAPFQHVPHSAILEYITFKRSFLYRLRPAMASAREEWPRFLCIKADAENGHAMAPCISPGTILLIDRHYNSLRAYRRKNSNLYAVCGDEGVLFRHVEPQNGSLLLRPQSREFPLVLIATGSDGRLPADRIIGRVCHAGREL